MTFQTSHFNKSTNKHKIQQSLSNIHICKYLPYFKCTESLRLSPDQLLQSITGIIFKLSFLFLSFLLSQTCTYCHSSVPHYEPPMFSLLQFQWASFLQISLCFECWKTVNQPQLTQNIQHTKCLQKNTLFIVWFLKPFSFFAFLSEIRWLEDWHPYYMSIV